MNNEILSLNNELINGWINQYKPLCSPDIILTICNGGKNVGELLSNKLKIPQKFVTIKSYNKDNTQGNIKLIGEFPTLENNIKNLLIVDDIWDSGNTLMYVLNQLESINNNIKLCMIYTVVEKKKYPHKTFISNKFSYRNDSSCVVPANTWIKFPWEKD